MSTTCEMVRRSGIKVPRKLWRRSKGKKYCSCNFNFYKCRLWRTKRLHMNRQKEQTTYTKIRWREWIKEMPSYAKRLPHIWTGLESEREHYNINFLPPFGLGPNKGETKKQSPFDIDNTRVPLVLQELHGNQRGRGKRQIWKKGYLEICPRPVPWMTQQNREGGRREEVNPKCKKIGREREGIGCGRLLFKCDAASKISF